MAAQHQHYVPQLLLRGFLSRDPAKAAKDQVHVFDLEAGTQFTPSITNIMGERRYNDFWVDEETLATVEPAAGRIESHVAPLVDRIRAEKHLRTVS
jgi:ethanolamine utilization cobalamin adenosyltransferase